MKTLTELTTVLIVDAIEPCLPTWEALGYTVSVRVPETGTLGFVILKGEPGELMLQTRDSLKEDLPTIAKSEPELVLYGKAPSLDAAKKSLPNARVLIEERVTFYGAKEAWFELEGGVFLGVAEHAA
jgi:hypothetical protein